MRENERRRILDQVAEAVHRGDTLDLYQDQVDRLVVEAGMPLDAIEAEVNDRISRIQTDEEIDNLRSSVKKKGLLIGGVTAVVLFLLSLAGSYLLMQMVLPAPEPTPTPTATVTPVVIAAQPAGHWLFSIETREVQPAADDLTQAIVTVHVIDKDGNPAPDGLEARFSVTSGDITPRAATARNGALTALYTGIPGALPAMLEVTVQHDTVMYQMPAFGSKAVVPEQTPTETPTPEVSPTPTSEPTPEPIELTVDWTPRYSPVIEIGVGQSLTTTITVYRHNEPVSGVVVNITAVNGLVTLDGASSSAITTDDTGTATIELNASDNIGDDTLQISADAAGPIQLYQVRVLPVATILKANTHLRIEPVMAQTKWKGGSDAPAEQKGSSFAILGQHPCYGLDGVTEADFHCYLVWDLDGKKYWLQGDTGILDIRPAGAAIEEVGRDAAQDSSAASTASSTDEEESVIASGQGRLQAGDAGSEDKISLWKENAGQTALVELPENVNVEVLQEDDQAAFVQVRIVLWVPVNNVTGSEPPSLTNPNASVETCGYQPGKAPDDEGSKYCGSLKQVAPAIGFARSLTADEKNDETGFGQGKWKLVVIDVWVKNENLSIGP